MNWNGFREIPIQNSGNDVSVVDFLITDEIDQ
jgi:hypothetical protein